MSALKTSHSVISEKFCQNILSWNIFQQNKTGFKFYSRRTPLRLFPDSFRKQNYLSTSEERFPCFCKVGNSLLSCIITKNTQGTIKRKPMYALRGRCPFTLIKNCPHLTEKKCYFGAFF